MIGLKSTLNVRIIIPEPFSRTETKKKIGHRQFWCSTRRMRQRAQKQGQQRLGQRRR